MNVRSGAVPVATDPAAPGEDEDDVVTAVAVTPHHHARLVMHVCREEIRPNDRPFLPHDRNAAVGVALALDLGPLDVVDVPERGLDAVDLR